MRIGCRLRLLLEGCDYGRRRQRLARRPMLNGSGVEVEGGTYVEVIFLMQKAMFKVSSEG